MLMNILGTGDITGWVTEKKTSLDRQTLLNYSEALSWKLI